MSLIIEDPEVDRLASEISKITGENLSDVLTVALRERLERVEKLKSVQHLIDDIHKITSGVRASLEASGQSFSSTDHAELMYDEHGSPK